MFVIRLKHPRVIWAFKGKLTAAIFLSFCGLQSQQKGPTYLLFDSLGIPKVLEFLELQLILEVLGFRKYLSLKVLEVAKLGKYFLCFVSL